MSLRNHLSIAIPFSVSGDGQDSLFFHLEISTTTVLWLWFQRRLIAPNDSTQLAPPSSPWTLLKAFWISGCISQCQLRALVRKSPGRFGASFLVSHLRPFAHASVTTLRYSRLLLQLQRESDFEERYLEPCYWICCGKKDSTSFASRKSRCTVCRKYDHKERGWMAGEWEEGTAQSTRGRCCSLLSGEVIPPSQFLSRSSFS